MDSVLDFLFLRRLRLNYISPPICPIPLASASGQSVPVQSICPLLCPDAPTAVTVPDNHFLVWDIEPLAPGCCTNVVCYNLYQQIGSSFVAVSECQSPNTLVVCDAATWTVSAIFSTGVETAPTGPFVSDGLSPLTIPLPFAEGVTAYRVTKNGVTVLLQFFSAGYQVCSVPVCYAVSQITSDGETCLSGTTCFTAPPPPPPVNSLHDVAAYWKFDDGPTSWLDSVSTNNFTSTPRVTPVTGIINGGAHSDGFFGAGWITAPDSAVLGAGPGVSFSYSLWVKVLPAAGSQDNLSGGRPIFSKINGGLGANGEYGLSHDNTDDGVSFQARVGNNTTNARVNIGPNSIPPYPDVFWDITTGGDGLWHHIACGYDDALQELWIQVDNSARYTTACAGVHRDPTKDLLVFQFNDLSIGGYFTIDEMGLWKRTLTTAEVTTLFNGGNAYALSNFYP